MTPAHRAARIVRVAAPAKINLTLQMLGVRADGYHELRTEFQSLALHDTLTFTTRPGPFQIVCSDLACPSDSTNLIWGVTERIWRAAGHRSAVTGLAVRVVKRIPVQAGLGGGSSDAAATIRALEALWRVNLGTRRVHRIAADIGADVPFFLEGGSAVGVGRGDVLIRMADAPPAWVVLVLPAFGVSTRDAYGWWDAGNPGMVAGPTAAPSTVTRAGVARLNLANAANRPRSRVPVLPGNDLQSAVARRHPEIASIVSALNRLGSTYAAMSGSGSAVFGLFDTRVRAEAAAETVAGRARRTLVTRTLTRTMFRRLTRPSRTP
jgi:4-diphosphocytidyl-2-C-methyl-D-erythritol kinase